MTPYQRHIRATSRHLLVRKNNDPDLVVRVDGSFTYDAGRNAFKRDVKAGLARKPKN